MHPQAVAVALLILRCWVCRAARSREICAGHHPRLPHGFGSRSGQVQGLAKSRMPKPKQTEHVLAKDGCHWFTSVAVTVKVHEAVLREHAG